jgi:hypothetical protein
MIRVFLLAIGALRAVFLSRADLVLENLALRQQLAAFARNGQRPRIVAADCSGSLCGGFGCDGPTCSSS